MNFSLRKIILHCRLGYLLDHTDPTMTPSPLFAVTMELDEGSSVGPVFIPALDSNLEENFMQMIEGIMNDICHPATLLKRVLVHDTTNEIESIQPNDEAGEKEEQHFLVIFL